MRHFSGNCNGIASIEQGRGHSRDKRGYYSCQLVRQEAKNVQFAGIWRITRSCDNPLLFLSLQGGSDCATSRRPRLPRERQTLPKTAKGQPCVNISNRVHPPPRGVPCCAPARWDCSLP